MNYTCRLISYVLYYITKEIKIKRKLEII